MRLHTITVRHYRRHKELRIELDAARTLIGGPNESGKSTLVEAVHRALFLRAKGNSKDHREMISLTHDGKPEVEVEFEAGGSRYTLIKSFKGSGGTVRLIQTGGNTWQGDEAEERLHQILKPNQQSNKLPDQWSHLWIWQGSSADDPLKQAQAERDTLVQRLQAQGGAAVIQSAQDAQIATHFAQQVDAIFKANGDPKISSDYGRALEMEKKAMEAETQSRDILQKLQQAIQDHEQAGIQLSEAETALKGIEKERVQLEQRQAEITGLRQQEQEHLRSVKEATLAYEALALTDKKVAELKDSLKTRHTEQSPNQARFNQLEKELQEARQAAEAAENDYRQAEENLRHSRACYDLAQAQASLTEKEHRFTLLKQRGEKIEQLISQRTEIEIKVGTLPQVDAKTLGQLQDLERAHLTAEAVLKSVATEIEIITTDEAVQIGDDTLREGEKRVLTAETHLRIGHTDLRIRPGGGTGLSEAKRKALDISDQLQAALSKLAVKNIHEAREAYMQREQLLSEWKNLSAELKGLGADKISIELSTAEKELLSIQAEVVRRGGGVLLDLQTAQKALQAAEHQQRSLRIWCDQTVATAKKAEAEYQSLVSSMRELEQQIIALETQLRFIQEREGDDAARALALTSALTGKTTAETQWQAIRQTLARQEPDQLAADRLRIDRIWEAQSAKKAAAYEKRITAATLLRSDGSNDPNAALTLAQASRQQAQTHLRNTERHARAIHRVHELIQQEQQELADEFTRPLAAKVSSYLKRMFGQDVRVNVSIRDNEFQSLTLCRGDEGSLPFENLSQGAREQIAAAFRLAMAEILAESHDGTLPVVFDDAFAHSDPARVQSLQRMLDLAATRGLQIILLTCTPGDYAMLGAKELSLG